MTTQNIFADQTTDEQNQQASQQAPNTLDTILGSIRNEQGEQKYRSTEDALSALKHSQEYIPQLKTDLEKTKAELAALQAQLAKQDELESTVRKLAERQEQKATPPAIDEEALQKTILATLDNQSRAQKIKQNQDAVVGALVSQFGKEGAAKQFYAKAAELGLSADRINDIAGESPQAVLQLFGVTVDSKGVPRVAPTASRTAAQIHKQVEEVAIGRETVFPGLGATDQDHQQLFERSRGMLKTLEKEGLTLDDLLDPTVYFKHFK